MDTLIKDIRVGIRSLLKRPGFTLVAILTLAIGIGASTAIFSVVDGVLLRPLPYPQAEQLVQLREVNPRGGKIRFAEPNFLDLRTRSRSFAGSLSLTIATSGAGFSIDSTRHGKRRIWMSPARRTSRTSIVRSVNGFAQQNSARPLRLSSSESVDC